MALDQRLPEVSTHLDAVLEQLLPA